MLQHKENTCVTDMAAMAKFSITSFALKWYFFNCPSSTVLFGAYFNLFMKQLGFNPAQIGLTTLLGLPQLLIPLYLMFGEKFRARKTLAVLGTAGLSVCCMLPLLSLIVPALQPTYVLFHNFDRFFQRNTTRYIEKWFSAFEVCSQCKQPIGLEDSQDSALFTIYKHYIYTDTYIEHSFSVSSLTVLRKYIPHISLQTTSFKRYKTGICFQDSLFTALFSNAQKQFIAHQLF